MANENLDIIIKKIYLIINDLKKIILEIKIKSFSLKTFLVLLLIVSSDCGAAQMLNKAFCMISLLPFKWMLEDAIKGKSLVIKFLIDA